MTRDSFNRWLQGPLTAHWQALLGGMVAVWIPSMIRLAVTGSVAGCEFTPYLPFVLICAILMRWWQAGAVALASVAILGGLFAGTPQFTASCFEPAAGIFLAASTSMIGIVSLLRRLLAGLLIDNSASGTGVVFSVEKGDVWATWNGSEAPVRLGSRGTIAEKMESFLADEKGDAPRRS